MIPPNKIKPGILVRSLSDRTSYAWYKESAFTIGPCTMLPPNTLGMVIRQSKADTEEYAVLVEGKLYFVTIGHWNIVE